MSILIKATIELTKIDKSKIRTTEDGRRFYSVDISINDEVRQFKNILQNVTIIESNSDREAKKNYIGNGKVVYSTISGVVVPKENDDI